MPTRIVDRGQAAHACYLYFPDGDHRDSENLASPSVQQPTCSKPVDTTMEARSSHGVGSDGRPSRSQPANRGRTIPKDRALSDLIGELSTRSEEFSTRWARHNVRLHHTATRTLHTSLVGEIALTGDAMHLHGDDLAGVAPRPERARIEHRTGAYVTFTCRR